MAYRRDSSANRFQNAASTIYSDNQSLIGEIRKFMGVMKEIAVDLEKANQHQMVKELENGVVELLGASDNCTFLSSAIDSIKSNYQPGEELTDFEKLFEDEIAKVKASSASDPQSHQLIRQFREAIWVCFLLVFL
ncbi:E3 sumo-protein ligase mms21 [Thalictrum thalictroides]|uniref:E3 sumo-protein ligase mms21 n=1 Tax=Thalictrum thalictroides TaxID=46969 RepID=A0A7J6VGY1_THATH|nr:E3 sumo-protein ligase mms21 [Thalictrum thalictroides]